MPVAYGALVGTVTATVEAGASVVQVDVEGAGVRRIGLGERLGRAAVIARGVADLPREVGWVVITEAQVTWESDALDQLLAAAERYPRAGALGPGIRRRDDRAAVLSAGTLPGAWDLVQGRVPMHLPGAEGPVGWLGADCLLVRRPAWDSVDGFDPRHLGPVDAVDLGARLGRAGWQSVYVPAAEVTAPDRGEPLLESWADGLRRYAGDRRGLRAAMTVAHRLRRVSRHHRSGE